MTDTPEQIPQWAMEKADEFWAEIHSHKLMPFSKEKIFARALAAEVERLTAERDALKEALERTDSHLRRAIAGLPIRDLDETQAETRRALEASK